jgi:hypothetical protein
MNDIETIRQQRDRLYAALHSLVGVESDKELREMELAIRIVGAPQGDMLVMIEAIHALLECKG